MATPKGTRRMVNGVYTLGWTTDDEPYNMLVDAQCLLVGFAKGDEIVWISVHELAELAFEHEPQ